MPKINRYVDINEINSELKKDYVDRHSPFIYCDDTAKKGTPFKVTIRVGQEYEHPDDFDHYISGVSLFNDNTKLAEGIFYAGTLGGQEKKGQTEVSFFVVLEKSASLVAQSTCTKHGLWESDPIKVIVS